MLLFISLLFLQISWGTKVDTIVETDLGAVVQDSHAEVDVEMFTEAADVNSLYEEALFNLKNRKPAPTKGNGILSNSEKEQNAKDYYANVRTNVRCFPLTIKQRDLVDVRYIGSPSLGLIECKLSEIPVMYGEKTNTCTGLVTCCNTSRRKLVRNFQPTWAAEPAEGLHDFHPHIHGNHELYSAFLVR